MKTATSAEPSDACAMADFQSRFLGALLAREPLALDGHPEFAAQPAFAVYRNSFAKACIDALEANYPVVLQLVGRTWFRAVAAEYVPTAPPGDGRLLHYGADLPEFLRPYAHAHGLDYLPSVASLDALWRVSLGAAEAGVLDPRRLAALSPEALAACVLRPHPAARWAHFDTLPVGAIWRRERARLEGAGDGAAQLPQEVPWQGDGVLLTRPGDSVRCHPLDAAGCRFLDACAEGLPLSAAAERGLACDTALDLARLLQCLLEAGAFCERPLP